MRPGFISSQVGVACLAYSARGDVALLEHRAEHEVALADRVGRGFLGARLAVRVLVRVEERWRLRQRGQEGGLRDRHVVERSVRPK